MRTVTVTIGRNVGERPMSQDRWNAFIAETKATVSKATSELWADGPSKSQWHGNVEENYFLYGPVKSTEAAQYLSSRLETIASYYKQDAIGFSFGESELAHGWESYSDPELDGTNEYV